MEKWGDELDAEFNSCPFVCFRARDPDEVVFGNDVKLGNVEHVEQLRAPWNNHSRGEIPNTLQRNAVALEDTGQVSGFNRQSGRAVLPKRKRSIEAFDPGKDALAGIAVVIAFRDADARTFGEFEDSLFQRFSSGHIQKCSRPTVRDCLAERSSSGAHMTVFLKSLTKIGVAKLLIGMLGGLVLAGCGAARAESSPSRVAMNPSSADYYAEESESSLGEMDSSGADEVEFKDVSATPRLLSKRAGISYKLKPPPPAAAAETDDGHAEPPSEEREQEATEPETTEPEPSDADVPRKPILIYEAHLGMAVFRAQENLDRIEQMAVKAGGYLVNRGSSSIQVRVPAPDFQSALKAIMALGDVHRKDIKAQDVTAQYTDTAIRLRNAQAIRERLEQLLASAKNVEEALQVEAELGRVTDEIERMKGRLKLLQELAAFSTITVKFTERTRKVQTRVELPFPWLDELGLHHLLEL